MCAVEANSSPGSESIVLDHGDIYMSRSFSLHGNQLHA